MAFSMRFDSQSKYLSKVDELIIDYHGELDTFEEFLEAHKDQRIVVALDKDFKPYQVALFEPFLEKYKNWALRFDEIDKETVDTLHDMKIPFFINKNVTGWDAFAEMLSYGVSDIYISCEIAFEIDKVAAVAHEHGTKVRVFPNVAQSNYNIQMIKSFFIRPEDIELYDPYVDVYEIYHVDSINDDVFYHVYAEQKKWFGELREIIFYLDTDADSRYIAPRFGERRLKCGKKCFKGGRCDMCNTIYKLSKTLDKAGILIERSKPTKNRSAEEKQAIMNEFSHAKEKIENIKPILNQQSDAIESALDKSESKDN